MIIKQIILSDFQIMLELNNDVISAIDYVNKTLFSETQKVEYDTAGFALLFHNYSKFLCKYRIYIENIYFREEYLANRYGKALLQYIYQLIIERYYDRVEWLCIDWNKSSIDFYLKLVIKVMSDWIVYRLDRKTIKKIAE